MQCFLARWLFPDGAAGRHQAETVSIFALFLFFFFLFCFLFCFFVLFLVFFFFFVIVISVVFSEHNLTGLQTLAESVDGQSNTVIMFFFLFQKQCFFFPKSYCSLARTPGRASRTGAVNSSS